MRSSCALAFIFVVSANAQTLTTTNFFGSETNQSRFGIEFVEIGNPGNLGNSPHGPGLSWGSVPYIYNLSKYEISRDMIEKANNQGGLGISLWDMTNYGGNGSKRPATGVSWNEAAKFVNWLNTSTGYHEAYNFVSNGVNNNASIWETSLQSGNSKFRHKDAFYFLPNENEWYKAAFGTPEGTWTLYPTGGSNALTSVSGGTESGTAVYMQASNSGPSDVDNAGGLSAFGTMGQGGNVYEWIDLPLNEVNPSSGEPMGLRGGYWADTDSWNMDYYLRYHAISYGDPASEDFGTGFRIGSVPEPSALSLLAVGLGGLAILRPRRS